MSLTACSHQPARQEPVPPPTIPYTRVWSADPGIDLFSRGAELIRATFESGQLYAQVGHPSFPGYENALNVPKADAQLGDWWNSGTIPPKAVTDYAHIVDFTADDHAVEAVVCDYAISPDTAVEYPDQLNSATRIRLENTGTDPGRASIANTNPEHYDPRAQMPPTWNVFGPWKITRTGTLSLAWQPIPEGCLAWWKQAFPGFAPVGDGDGSRTGLYPPAKYIPPHHPVLPQFPEWIGPSTAS
ncbi:hypothetical protein GPX89_34250 [Nocardia sp. ET3-3]|uniref:Uncharacterized protein n=1 Tax=Nocardia terrae TaxID=2675851 RepID=A0A7K1V6R3_9NOCA|nr:hypothetical protein [Nocardia terrae]MVU82286.1 hypothetical protein [Nocardia terrae]